MINAAAGALVLAALTQTEPLRVLRARGWGASAADTPSAGTLTLEQWQARDAAAREANRRSLAALADAPTTMLVEDLSSPGLIRTIYSHDFDPSYHRPL